MGGVRGYINRSINVTPYGREARKGGYILEFLYGDTKNKLCHIPYLLWVIRYNDNYNNKI